MTHIPLSPEGEKAVSDVLNTLEFVRWDRLVADATSLRVYGWVGRPDEKQDFVLIDFLLAAGAVTGLCFITSSARWSDLIAEALIGKAAAADAHVPCQRVEAALPDVANVVKLPLVMLAEGGPEKIMGEDGPEVVPLRYGDGQGIERVEVEPEPPDTAA